MLNPTQRRQKVVQEQHRGSVSLQHFIYLSIYFTHSFAKEGLNAIKGIGMSTHSF